MDTLLGQEDSPSLALRTVLRIGFGREDSVHIVDVAALHKMIERTPVDVRHVVDVAAEDSRETDYILLTRSLEQVARHIRPALVHTVGDRRSRLVVVRIGRSDRNHLVPAAGIGRRCRSLDRNYSRSL